MAPDPLRDRVRGTGPSLAIDTFGVEGYVNSVQRPPPPPLPFRNSWIRPCIFRNLMMFEIFLK